MAKAITIKQLKFTEEYLKTGNGTQSALKVYNTTSTKTARSLASENISKPNVRALIEQFSHGAIKRMDDLSRKARSEQVKYYANKDLLDRAGYKPQDEQVGNKTLVINISGESAERYGLLNKVQELSNMEVKEIEKPSENG